MVKLEEMLSWKWLSKYISKLIFRRDMSDTKSTILNLIPYEMKIYGNRLHSRMKNGIGTELSGPNIITINDRAVGKRNTKIGQEITNEIKFSSSICNGATFCLSGRSSNSPLLFRTLGNWIFSKINNISTG